MYSIPDSNEIDKLLSKLSLSECEHLMRSPIEALPSDASPEANAIYKLLTLEQKPVLGLEDEIENKRLSEFLSKLSSKLFQRSKYYLEKLPPQILRQIVKPLKQSKLEKDLSKLLGERVLDAKSEMALSCHRLYSTFQPERLMKVLHSSLSCSDYPKVKDIVIRRPAILSEYAKIDFKLIPYYSIAMPFEENFTPLQHALWLMDWQICELFLSLLPADEAEKQISEFLQVNSSCDLDRLKKAYKDCLDYYDNNINNPDEFSLKEMSRLWLAIGASQRDLPFHLLSLFFGPNPFRINKSRQQSQCLEKLFVTISASEDRFSYSGGSGYQDLLEINRQLGSTYMLIRGDASEPCLNHDMGNFKQHIAAIRSDKVRIDTLIAKCMDKYNRIIEHRLENPQP